MLVEVMLEVVDDDLKWLKVVVVLVVVLVVVGAAFHRRNQLYSVRCGLAARTDDRAQDTTRTNARTDGAWLIHALSSGQGGEIEREGKGCACERENWRKNGKAGSSKDSPRPLSGELVLVLCCNTLVICALLQLVLVLELVIPLCPLLRH